MLDLGPKSDFVEVEDCDEGGGIIGTLIGGSFSFLSFAAL
jgi:hypothetical protein